MNIEIIKSNLDGNLIDTVSARKIHEEVGSQTPFDKWIVRRLEQGGFIEGQDFTTVLSKSTGGRPSTEYHVILDMAKHLGMMERNEQGKKVRQYFIDIDKNALPQPLSRLELAKLQVQMIEDLEAKKAEVKSLKIELDESHEWATIKRVEMVTGEEYSWRKLKAVCIELDIPRKDVFDANYGTVKSYHADVWGEAYGIDLKSLEAS